MGEFVEWPGSKESSEHRKPKKKVFSKSVGRRFRLQMSDEELAHFLAGLCSEEVLQHALIIQIEHGYIGSKNED